MDGATVLVEAAARLDPYLDAAVPAASVPPERLHAAMRHLLFPGGKRLRPAFAFAACESAGAAPERALPLAAAVELVHTYSLVHDDLPCMDDDDERRGRPSVHRAFDEATAVLAGDALQALAFEVLATATHEAGPAAVAAASAELAAAAGSRRLVGGQALDLAFARGGEDEAERVEAVHLRKSAALLAASVVGGALLGGATPELLARLRKFGEEVGVAFQIADDLLDAGADEACSLARVLGPERARERAETLLAGALARIEDLGDEAGRLRALARASVRRVR
jgi:geranylgeranyl pyrophosphate synthase